MRSTGGAQRGADSGGLKSKSNICSNVVSSIINSEVIMSNRENEFEEMVSWVTQAEEKIANITGGSAGNSFANVRFAPIISSLLNLLDAQILSREH